mgnify:CR=1 FL=1
MNRDDLKILKPKNAKIKIISNHVVIFIFFKLSKNPESSPDKDVDEIGFEASLDCNIEPDKLFELSIIIKIYILILCFTKKVLSDLSKLDLYKEMLSKSVEFAKKFYQVILYTDSETLPDLETIQVEKRLVDSSDFYFIDDFKVYLLDKVLCENSTLIDVDLFLFKPLNFQEGFDLYADYKEKSTEEWYTQYIDILLENGVRELLPDFGSKIYFPPNIGIIKFTNLEYKRKYIDTYNLLKNWIV